MFVLIHGFTPKIWITLHLFSGMKDHMQITLTSYLKENTVVKVCHFHWHRIFITFFACVFFKKVLIDFTTVTCPVIKFLLCTEYSTLQKPWMCVFFAEYRLQLKTENNIKNVIIHFEMFCSRPLKYAGWYWSLHCFCLINNLRHSGSEDIMQLLLLMRLTSWFINRGNLIFTEANGWFISRCIQNIFWVIIISFRSLSMEWIKQHINVEHIWWYVASHRVLANQKQEI